MVHLSVISILAGMSMPSLNRHISLPFLYLRFMFKQLILAFLNASNMAELQEAVRYILLLINVGAQL